MMKSSAYRMMWILYRRRSAKYLPLTERHSRLPPSFTPCPLAHACAQVFRLQNRNRKDMGLTAFHKVVPERVGAAFSPVMPRLCTVLGEYRILTTSPFGACLSASLACCHSRGLSAVHVCSPYSQSLAPPRVMMLAEMKSSHESFFGNIVPWLHTPHSSTIRRLSG